MLEVWLVYNEADIKYNRGSIEIYQRAFADKARLTVLSADDLDMTALDNGKGEIKYNGGSIIPPDVVINRTRSARLAYTFADIAPHVYNNPLIASLGNDKLQALTMVSGLGIRTMPVYGSVEDIDTWPVVAKTRSGHGGQEVFLARNREEVIRLSSQYDDLFCQRYSKQGNRDIRVYIVGGRIVCSMLRSSQDDFRSNYSLGGAAVCTELPGALKDCVHTIAGSLGDTGYLGIDFIGYGDGWVFNELEDVVGARMVYAHTEYDPIGEFVRYILSQVM